MDPGRRNSALDACWQLLLAAAAWARSDAGTPGAHAAFAVGSDHQPIQVDSLPDATLYRQGTRGWRCHPRLTEPSRAFLDLYLPLCEPLTADRRVVAHLGQSLNGCIATHGGDAEDVTGPDNIRHLHCMRALSDAVIVGAGTVASDDPRLTTRLVPGPNPVRVLVDPRARLGADYRVFTDGLAPTVLCRTAGTGSAAPGRVELIELPDRGGRFGLGELLDVLAQRGLRRLFVEGGGVTVSDFLTRGLLDRLQIAVAPLIIGGGRVGIRLPPHDAMKQAFRNSVRIFRMGADVLYDFDLANAGDAVATAEGIERLI